MSIDTDWEFKANHWEREAKRLIAENNNLKNELLRLEGKPTLKDFADRLFQLHGFMMLEEYRNKPAVTVTFPDKAEASQFHWALCDLSRHKTPETTPTH